MLVSFERSADKQRRASRKLAVLGSTGSIGVSTLDIARRYPQNFAVEVLAAGKNIERIVEQAKEFRPKLVVVSQANDVAAVRSSLPHEIRVLSGDGGLLEAAAYASVDIVMGAITGVAGLAPTLEALRAGKTVALANKESVVCGAPLLKAELERNQSARIIPVDSEHASLYQLLKTDLHSVERLVLTASGGPFLNTPLSQLREVTAAQAINHPRWKMGPKISVDSSTLMNKALEVMEAHFLYGFEPERIEVVVHPQSIVHAMVLLRDGTHVAHLSPPDMRGPIAYALSAEVGRLEQVIKPLAFTETQRFDFQALDAAKFPAVTLAHQALRKGPSACCALSVANERVVERFLAGGFAFLDIVPTVQRIADEVAACSIASLADVRSIGAQVEAVAAKIL